MRTVFNGLEMFVNMSGDTLYFFYFCYILYTIAMNIKSKDIKVNTSPLLTFTRNTQAGACYKSVSSGRAIKTFEEAARELLRKSIHLLIALTPTLASYNKNVTVALLTGGVLFYIVLESLRIEGIKVPFFSMITQTASRERDGNGFVMGPVTLGSGALIALMLYPSSAAAIAIYALAFGDAFASIVGRIFGQLRPAFLCGKSIEGSVACFIAVFIAAYKVSKNPLISSVAALAATIVEALPLEDYDNIAIPLAVGMTVTICQLQ
ncbi:phosphatidate cytidylyltransferase [Spirochaetia bacterium]|nr:phosphatidate cytidylyltransferase [Spirochaetia bacterium]